MEGEKGRGKWPKKKKPSGKERPRKFLPEAAEMLHHKPIFPDIIFHLASRVTWQLQTNALRSVSASLWHWQAVRDSNTTERIFLPCFHYIIQPIQGGEGGGTQLVAAAVPSAFHLQCMLVCSADSYWSFLGKRLCFKTKHPIVWNIFAIVQQ